VDELLASYMRRFREDFYTSLPPSMERTTELRLTQRHGGAKRERRRFPL
jgi:hypothetical protein